MFNGEQVNDHIEQDDHVDDVIEDDGTNTLIHDSFNVRMDDDDVDNENIDEFDDVHDIPLLDKAYEPLYEGSKTNLLSAILLIVFIHEFCDKMSNRNIPNPNEHNR